MEQPKSSDANFLNTTVFNQVPQSITSIHATLILITSIGEFLTRLNDKKKSKKFSSEIEFLKGLDQELTTTTVLIQEILSDSKKNFNSDLKTHIDNLEKLKSTHDKYFNNKTINALQRSLDSINNKNFKIISRLLPKVFGEFGFLEVLISSFKVLNLENSENQAPLTPVNLGLACNSMVALVKHLFPNPNSIELETEPNLIINCFKPALMIILYESLYLAFEKRTALDKYYKNKAMVPTKIKLVLKQGDKKTIEISSPVSILNTDSTDTTQYLSNNPLKMIEHLSKILKFNLESSYINRSLNGLYFQYHCIRFTF